MDQVAALFVPLVLAAMVPRFLRPYPNGLPCVNPDVYLSYPWSLQLGLLSQGGVFGPVSNVTKGELRQFVPNKPDFYGYSTPPEWRYTTFVDSMDGFNDAIKENVSSNSYLWGGFYIGEQITFAFEGLDSISSLFVQGSLHMILSNTSFGVNTESFVQPYVPDDSW